jgi:hypothetical protein
VEFVEAAVPWQGFSNKYSNFNELATVAEKAQLCRKDQHAPY